jgi:hypothetical protein
MMEGTIPIDRWIEDRLKANDLAVRVASEALTIRLEHSNGLIEQMRRQATEFARKTEVDAEIYRLREDLKEVQNRQAEDLGVGRGKERLSQILMLIVGAAISVAAVKLGGR